jgi:Domain of unknown function (DUF5615)
VTAARFLIDENLSPELVTPAHQRGYEAMHVNHLGLRPSTRGNRRGRGLDPHPHAAALAPVFDREIGASFIS